MSDVMMINLRYILWIISTRAKNGKVLHRDFFEGSGKNRLGESEVYENEF